MTGTEESWDCTTAIMCLGLLLLVIWYINRAPVVHCFYKFIR